jgi:hypothetical protein
MERLGGGEGVISASKIIGSCWNILDNATYGPTGAWRITGNSIEDAACAEIAFIQAVAGVEHANAVIVGNQLNSLGAGKQTYYGLIYASTGTPTSKPKWLENVTISGNVLLGGSTLGQGLVNFQDGAGISIAGNVFNNQSNDGSGGAIQIGSSALAVTISGNTPERLGNGGLFGTVYWPVVNTSLSPAPNLLINGGMAIDQINEGALVSVGSAGQRPTCVDAWRAQFTTAATGITCQRVTNAPPDAQFATEIIIGTGSATVNAGDYGRLQSYVEGSQLQALAFGGANAKPVTASIWLNSSIAATVGIAIKNAANSRSYVSLCSITATNTWTKCAWVIPGDVTGTWVLSGTAAGLSFNVSMEAGANSQGAANTWLGSDTHSTSAQTQFTTTTGATLRIGAPKLEISSVPTPFVTGDTTTELMRAQRQYIKTFPQGTAPANSAGLAGALCTVGASTTIGSIGTEWRFPVEMRASPTITTYNPSAGNANWRNVTGAADAVVSVDVAVAKGTTGVPIDEITTAPVVASKYCIHAAADARF